jgi:hypothetical protein
VGERLVDLYEEVCEKLRVCTEQYDAEVNLNRMESQSYERTLAEAFAHIKALASLHDLNNLDSDSLDFWLKAGQDWMVARESARQWLKKHNV